jgi:hypothetical protein
MTILGVPALADAASTTGSEEAVAGRVVGESA